MNSISTDHSLPPASKRPHLESGDAGLWPYTSTNKPVGIAQPFQKKENIEVEHVATLQKQEDVLKSDLKPELDFKPVVNVKTKDDSTNVFCPDDERTSAEKKLSNQRHSSADSGSDSDSCISFSYPFKLPSESSDDIMPPGREEAEDQNVVSFGSTAGGGRKEEPTDSQISGSSLTMYVNSGSAITVYV